MSGFANVGSRLPVTLFCMTVIGSISFLGIKKKWHWKFPREIAQTFEYYKDKIDRAVKVITGSAVTTLAVERVYHSVKGKKLPLNQH